MAQATRPTGPEPADEVILEVEGMRKRWPNGRVALDGVDLTLTKGDVFVLLGPNGCGKSTFLRCLNGLEDYQEGRVLLRGTEVSRGRPSGHVPTRAEQDALSRLRQRVGMVFQQLNLFPHVDALHNVMMGPLHVQRRSRAESHAIALAALRKVGLEDRADHLPSELSGGQQQRVAIARTIAMSPEIVLFDEPTSALDPLLVREVFRVIRSLVFDDAMTMLLVTHDLDFARDVADRILFMDAGRIAVSGPPAEVFASDHPLVRRFLEE
ncbi:MAG TPA: amino acid ABC transporter ATP-binding protein [Myxococcota bacterium]|jgi:polar amino acid transport system ATP-binding protein|nr:amino acid ABC transporter ATP-binding protein [Myxococcota bacterium]